MAAVLLITAMSYYFINYKTEGSRIVCLDAATLLRANENPELAVQFNDNCSDDFIKLSESEFGNLVTKWVSERPEIQIQLGDFYNPEAESGFIRGLRPTAPFDPSIAARFYAQALSQSIVGAFEKLKNMCDKTTNKNDKLYISTDCELVKE